MASLLFAIGFTVTALIVFAFILNILYNGYANYMAGRGLPRSNQSTRNRGNNARNASNIPRAFPQNNANNLTSEFNNTSQLYTTPANFNRKDDNSHLYNLEAIRVEDNLQDSRIDSPPTYNK